MSAEVELLGLVIKYAADCPRARFAAAYELASMLEGYDPDGWRALAKSRRCDSITGRPEGGGS